jgi:hypothetical protein
MYGRNQAIRQFYQQTPEYGFPESVPAGMPTTLDDINPAYYGMLEAFIERHEGRLASISGVRLYDTLRVDAGIMPITTFTFYQNGLNENQSLFVASGTTYRKQNIDVSYWIDGGKLSKGYEALLWSMQVHVQLPGAGDNSVQAAGNAVNLPLDPGLVSAETAAAAGAAFKAGNLMRAIMESFYFEFFINNSTFEHGTADLFPTAYGAGNQLALAGVVAAPIADGMVSNTNGYCYSFPIMRHLPELTRFGVRMMSQNPFTTAVTLSPFRIKVILEGIGIQPLTG